EVKFLELLDRHTAQNLKVSNNKHSKNYAPKEFKKEYPGETIGFTARELEAAMKRLLGTKILNNNCGTNSQPRWHLVHDTLYGVPRKDLDGNIIVDPETPN